MYTICMLSPRTRTAFWPTIFWGAVKKKYARVRWNTTDARMIVKADISAIVS
jgi:hypothetical protein